MATMTTRMMRFERCCGLVACRLAIRPFLALLLHGEDSTAIASSTMPMLPRLPVDPLQRAWLQLHPASASPGTQTRRLQSHMLGHQAAGTTAQPAAPTAATAGAATAIVLQLRAAVVGPEMLPLLDWASG